jgi:hypothetical protein
VGALGQFWRVDHGLMDHVVGPERVSWCDLVGLDERGVEHGCAVDDVDGVHSDDDGDYHLYHYYGRYRYHYCNVWGSGCGTSSVVGGGEQ